MTSEAFGDYFAADAVAGDYGDFVWGLGGHGDKGIAVVVGDMDCERLGRRWILARAYRPGELARWNSNTPHRAR